MTIMIELPPEIAASLAVLAAQHGMALPDYVRQLLAGQLPSAKPAALSPEQRERLWRDSAKGMPQTLPLADEAVSRESFYDARG